MTAEKEALIFMNGKFHPICGRFFWDNRNGPDLFCKKLGYDQASNYGSRYSLPFEGVSLGSCSQNAIHFNSCQIYPDPDRSCPLYQIGGACKDGVEYCNQGKQMGIKIECKGGPGKRSSCEGNLQLRNRMTYMSIHIPVKS